MCSVVVSCRGTLWLFVGLTALVLQLIGILSPAWLLSPPPVSGDFRNYTPSVGVVTRCTELGEKNNCVSVAVDGFNTPSEIYPDPWKAAFFFLAMCAGIQFCTLLAGVLSCCVRAVCRKSVISLTGAAQALAGVLGVVGLLLQPWGWRSRRVLALCGDRAEPFLPAACSIGMGLYASAGGIAMTFVASALSKPADRAAESEKLQRHVEQGRHLICVS